MRRKCHDIPGTLEHAQLQAIVSALVQTKYNVSEACDVLQIGRSTLYRHLGDMGFLDYTFAQANHQRSLDTARVARLAEEAAIARKSIRTIAKIVDGGVIFVPIEENV